MWPAPGCKLDYLRQTEIACRVRLVARDAPYVVVTMAQGDGECAPFTLTAYSDTPVRLSRTRRAAATGSDGSRSGGGSRQSGSKVLPVPGEVP